MPDSSSIHYKLLTEGLKKYCTRPVKQADPITHQNLLKLFHQVNFAVELEAVVWVAVLVGFTLVLRISNLGPTTRADFNPNRNLTRADLQIQNGYPALGIRWSKTVQHRNRVTWAPLLASQTPEICPQYRMRKMYKMIPAKLHEPLFLVRQGNQCFPVTSDQINRILKQWTKQAELVQCNYTGHCLRRGGLNWAHDSKLTSESLQLIGDWKSSVYLRYIDMDYKNRIKAAKQMQKYHSSDNI